mmetsp:Transcript_115888/g.322668  ORF Transcript_115888/g.322668 Transcript_115888/m.322668 type:complete len:254 (-) Transcript_115888:75-836(-)|eukprot:CAMPEP_0179084672 /NCGR_PEP_ID=MMETSP0796-20121207/38304_1 /TAXON_ID=73915 /ORGANISM="Pyrodinium bahamense, Strain pbaha01" /LENGTH=253 /DNA_ID=CAMNT_0020782097 /DNA_START=38 /DNA_END=799 /DNA_ORIENTATION=-
MAGAGSHRRLRRTAVAPAALTTLAACAGLLAISAAGFVVAWPSGARRQQQGSSRFATARAVSAIDAPPAGYDTQRKVLPIVKYPHPALRRENEAIEVFDEKLHMLAVNLFDTLREEGGGVGLAAPQVGVNKRVMAYLEMRGDKAVGKLLVNPRITARSEDFDSDIEECLSFPGIKGPVERPIWVDVEAQTVDGKMRTMRIEGFEARLFQHEYDHLDGVVFIDHLDENSRSKNQLKLETLKQQYTADGGEDPAP